MGKLDITKLHEFTQILLNNYDTPEFAQKAFELVAPDYGIGFIDITLVLKPGAFSKNGQDSRMIAYRNIAGYNEEVVWQKEFDSGEGGHSVTRVFAIPGREGWNREEKAELDTLVTIVILHAARFNLVNRVKQTAMTNYQTGLPNSGGYLEFAAKLYEQGTLSDYNAYQFNLKGTGLLNLKFGPGECDKLIVQYADKCKLFLDYDECIGHLGGDNFTALIKKQREEEFKAFLGGVTLEAHIGETIVPVVVKATAGVMKLTDRLPGTWMIMSGITVALTRAKATGSSYLVLTDKILSDANRQKEIQQIFAASLSRGEFVTYYQPKVDTRNGQIVGCEALARWINDGNVILPVEFIPTLEKTGQIEDLDLYILENSCRSLYNWKNNGEEAVPLSVNFSRRDLEDPMLADKIIAIIRKYNVQKPDILIEITETATEKEKVAMKLFLDKLSDNNIATSIDDFGTGFSSLGAIRDYNVSEIKIDRSFINHVVLQKKDSVIIGSVITMAKDLGIDVITEGVENEEQVRFLQNLGCYKVQGYLYDKPLPRLEFEEKLKRKYYSKEL